MTRLPFVLVTGNPGKLAEARRLAGDGLEAVALDLPEIQSLDLLAVLRAKADEAWRRLGRPLVVEEAGLELAALNGFPGPLVKWMLDAVGAEGIARAAAALGETRATARAALLVRTAEGERVAEGAAEGELVLPGRGGLGFGFDPVFLPAGGSRTFGELSGAEKDAVSHRGKAWRTLLEELAPDLTPPPAPPPAPPGR
ncbi:MAG TPA: non-canonical purine NTP pyrophosphatase [Thermoanaerobaculia bacterium]|nr:non-canonical purine NTP pyrophosphatase [Thermoanaerobaculia bacterium]